MFLPSTPQKILLIEPPFYRFFNYERWYYPVTLTLIGTYLDRLGHYVRVFDADKPSADCKPLSRLEVRNNYRLYEKALNNREHPIWLEIKETIEKFEPDIIGLTSVTAKIDSANIVARIAKQLYGDKVKVILGGSHVQGMQAMVPDYDFGSDYDEIVTHIPNLVDQTPNKNLIMNIEQYAPRNLMSILTLSGCPNQCTFCCHSFEKKITYRNIKSIREELSANREKFGEDAPVYIMDDCMLANSSRFTEIAAILKELGLKFTSGSRIMSLTPGKIEIFIKSGGLHINVGVESGSQRILDRVKKNLKIEEIVKRTKWLNDSGLSWSTFIIVGFPFETVNDLKLTEELIYLIKPTFVSINRFTPYPGTEIYKEYFLNSHLKFRDLFQLNSKSCVQLDPKVEDYIDYLFDSFATYNKKNIEKNYFFNKQKCEVVN